MAGTTESEQPLEADVWSDDDVDSGIASLASSSDSITSSILRSREENGRTYHAFKDGRYVLPNDESENERLDLQHTLCLLTFDGRLFTCPAGRDQPIRRVLDAGTGTGIWAMDFADEYPNAQVIGVDLSAIQPPFVPPNISFYVDDLEDPWTFSTKFDFIYGRMLIGSLRDWPLFIKQSYDNLNSGGWLELADVLLELQSDDNSVPADSPARKWGDLMLQAADKFGAPLDSCKKYKQQLADAGFVDIVETIYKWPTSGWPKDKKYKEMGLWTYEDLGQGASGLSLRLFTRALGWTKEEVEVFLVDPKKSGKPSLANLNHDIILLVIDHVHDTYPESLNKLTLVCSDLYFTARHVQYRRIQINMVRYKEADRLGPIVRNGLAPAIRSSHVKARVDHNDSTRFIYSGKRDGQELGLANWEQLENALPAMTGLRDLHLGPHYHFSSCA
ncbi:Phosphoethanolamine N-methyltransferase [Madurella mycetomatis]|uniref:Phosphoethanolamine N-methyltransferase n=1 Tax=Madurella mycetomatis TaxID=100816 RepID=A0A175WB05_9PEZI|nr:Phosphoethanolamine N-methyltransferase [Madurella mycetomatis]